MWEVTVETNNAVEREYVYKFMDQKELIRGIKNIEVIGSTIIKIERKERIEFGKTIYPFEIKFKFRTNPYAQVKPEYDGEVQVIHAQNKAQAMKLLTVLTEMATYDQAQFVSYKENEV